MKNIGAAKAEATSLIEYDDMLNLANIIFHQIYRDITSAYLDIRQR
jgi:hypothetical protein